MEVLGLRPGDDFKHAFHVDRFGAAGIENPVLPDGLVERRQVVLAVQLEENVIVEIHEDQRHRPPLVADAAIFQLELMRCGKDTGNPVHGVQPPGQIDVLGDIGQGFLLGHHRQQTGIGAFPLAVDGEQHLGKAHHRIEHRMIEIQVDPGGTDTVNFLPYHLGDFLGHALVVPTARTAEIPLRMIAAKTGHA